MFCFGLKNIHCLQIFDTGFYPKTMLQKGFGFIGLKLNNTFYDFFTGFNF
jgi:hypothetical protein